MALPVMLDRISEILEFSEVPGAVTSFLACDEPIVTKMERVWTRMKTAATKLAQRQNLVSVTESRDTVLKICRSEKANAPPPDALEYLSTELVRLTSERQLS